MIPRTPQLIQHCFLLLACVLFSSCANATALSTPAPLPTVLSFTPLSAMQPTSSRISTLVYFVPEESGASLHDALSYEQEKPQSLTAADRQIWCDASCAGQLTGNAIVLVIAQGFMEGPGSYGPQGKYRWQLKEARLIAQPVEETSISRLLQRTSYYTMRPVRVNGTILLNTDSALLLDEIGPGGIPSSTSQQLKLRWLHPDQQLIQRLKLLPGSDIRSGRIQVEGYLSNAALVPLSVRIIDVKP